MADQWRVVNNTGERPRLHFAGTENDARQFVADHFPRAHVEPPDQNAGVPDVKLVSPDGVEDRYHADDGWESERENDEPKTEADEDAEEDK